MPPILRALTAVVMLASPVLLAPGCAVVKTISYEKTGETREVDAITGETVVTAYWRYSDGVQAMTFLRIPKGNEQRRNDRPLPPSSREVD
jgi:hypothetical protein